MRCIYHVHFIRSYPLEDTVTRRRISWLSGLTLAAAAGIVACNKPAAPSTDLSRDLEAASSASSAPTLTLAPTSGSRETISAVEQAPEARHAPALARAQPVQRRAAPPVQTAQVIPQSVTPPVTQSPTATVAQVPAAASPAANQATPSRRPTPIQQGHQGRYKTEAEIFRDAPFPITP
jgi:hypothetical protein